MIKAKHIILTSALLSVLYTGNKLMANASKNFSHNLKFRVPLDKIGLKVQLTQSAIQAVLEIKNNYYQDIEVEGVNMTVYMKNSKTGNIEEIASTRPSPKQYFITRNSITNINDIQVDVDNLALVKNGISSLLNYQKGGRLFKLLISGYAGGFPFSTKIWY